MYLREAALFKCALSFLSQIMPENWLKGTLVLYSDNVTIVKHKYKL